MFLFTLDILILWMVRLDQELHHISLLPTSFYVIYASVIKLEG